MSPIERKKFEEEFIEDYILYTDILIKETSEISREEFENNGLEI
jgi:hypothetical protein